VRGRPVSGRARMRQDGGGSGKCRFTTTNRQGRGGEPAPRRLSGEEDCMKRILVTTGLVTTGLAALSLLPAVVQAQSYPQPPIRLIVPFSPGGTSDLMGRVVGERLGDGLGTTVVVDNRGGAGGTLGAALGAQAAPDGYTLLVHHVGLAV